MRRKIMRYLPLIGAVIVVVLVIAIRFMQMPIKESVISEFEGHIYAVFDATLNWNEAQRYCENLGGYLVTITSEAEQEFIEGLLSEQTKNIYWIGLYYDMSGSHWRWVTDEGFDYVYWEEGQPNDTPGNMQNYVGIIANQTSWGRLIAMPYFWHDFVNEARAENPDRFGFICEWNSADDRR